MVSRSCELFFCVPCIEGPGAVPAHAFWDVGEDLLVVDHTPTLEWAQLAAERGWRYVPVALNLGTNGAWNIGRGLLLAERRPQDLISFLSCSCILPMGLAEVRYALIRNASWKGVQAEGYGWHLMTLSGALLAELGTFDENLPHFWGDNDYVYRGILAGHFLAGPDSFPCVPLDAEAPRSGKALRSGRLLPINWEQLAAYYRAKWGGNTAEEIYRTPFDLPVATDWWSPAFRPMIGENGERLGTLPW
jgi:hypothetical protein